MYVVTTRLIKQTIVPVNLYNPTPRQTLWCWLAPLRITTILLILYTLEKHCFGRQCLHRNVQATTNRHAVPQKWN